MKLWLFCLMLGVLPGFGKDRPQEPVPITLYAKFEQEVPPAVMAAIQQEVGAIMEPIGINFDWRNLSLANGSEVSVELAVITFKGTCSTANLVPHASNPGSSWDGPTSAMGLSCRSVTWIATASAPSCSESCFTSTPASGTNSSGAPWAGCWPTSCTTFSRTPASMARAAWAKPRIRSRSCCPTISALRTGRARLYVCGPGRTPNRPRRSWAAPKKNALTAEIRPALSGTPGCAGGYCRSSPR